jgi:hypothetical protein
MRELGFSVVGLIHKRDRDRLEKRSRRDGGDMPVARAVAVVIVVSVVLYMQQTGGLTGGSLTHVAPSHVARVHADHIGPRNRPRRQQRFDGRY